MAKKLLEIAAEIVQAQASVSQMRPDQIEQALLKAFGTLQRMQRAEEEGMLLVSSETLEEFPVEGASGERIDAKDSIQENKVICMECGAEMKQLTSKHLSSHGLNIREYKRKWGLALKQPLSAKSLSRARRRAAKKRGLPENLVKYQEERRLKAGVKSAEEEAPATTPLDEQRESVASSKRAREEKAE